MRRRVNAAVWAFSLVTGGAMLAMAEPAAKLPGAASVADKDISQQELARLNALVQHIEDINQQIDARFEEILAELQVVKVRASMKHTQDDSE